MASVIAQNRLRQARTSPYRTLTPRNSLVPAASNPFIRSPARKSSLTAILTQPWNVKRGMKPEKGKKLFCFSTSP
ncbi:MAG: hypothetical protein QOI57_911 [Rubrobacteraceae bacterium]|jgi:hypothetical protein|nr:hypothetical protein [Rubrobacteraceae bacterium]